MKASAFFMLVLLTLPTRAQPALEEKKSAMTVEIENADSAYSSALTDAEAAYRTALARTLAKATRIEVFLLEPFLMEPAAEGGGQSADEFPILPKKHSTRILRRKELSQEEIKELLPALQSTVGVLKNEGGMMCHYPIHGLRVWDGDKIAFQTSICYECQNFYVRYPNGEAGFVSLSSEGFARIMARFMPVPVPEDPVRKEADGKAPSSGGKAPE